MTNQKQYKEVSIILVDDDDVDAIGIQRALNKLRILNPLLRARDGLEGLQLIQQHSEQGNPFIVLLDLNMPRMNGLEMLAEIRKNSDFSDAVVFVLTTSQSDEDRVAAYAQNIAGYIIKNAQADGFISLIEMLDRYWKVVALPRQLLS